MTNERPHRYDAVVFDMDGVLVDSEPSFYDAVNVVLAEEGRSIPFDDYRRFLGTSVQETWRGVISTLSLRGDLQSYIERYDGVLIDCLRAEKQPLPGVVELLDELDARGVPYALASSSWQSWVDVVLESAGLRQRFHRFSTPDVVEHLKPAPEIYLHAAGRLSVAAQRCIAVEDTLPGIASAKSAGMFAVQSRASSTALPPIEEADLVIESLEHFPLAMLPA